MPRIAVGLLVVGALGSGCARFDPQPMESIPFEQGAQTRGRSGLRVTVAVLSRSEAKRAFGVDPERRQIQPAWFENWR